MSSEPQMIWLIGPRSGKTSLLATMETCLAQEGHGYPTLDIQLNVESKAKAKARPAILKSSDFEAGDYQNISSLVKDSKKPEIGNKAKIYDFEFKRISTSSRKQEKTCPFSVIDIPSQMLMPDDPEDVYLNSGNTRKSLMEALRQTADAVILVLPLDSAAPSAWSGGPPAPPAWADNLKEIMTEIAMISRIRRFVVVFNKYECRFIYFGRQAFWLACRPEIVSSVLDEACNLPWLECLDLLAQSEDPGAPHERGVAAMLLRIVSAMIGIAKPPEDQGRDMVLVPASSFGFLKHFGNPNIDPCRTGPAADVPIEPSAGSPGGHDLWRPFCTADPFVFAVLGETSVMMRRFGFEPPDRGRILQARAAELGRALMAKTPRPAKAALAAARRIWEQR